MMSSRGSVMCFLGQSDDDFFVLCAQQNVPASTKIPPKMRYVAHTPVGTYTSTTRKAPIENSARAVAMKNVVSSPKTMALVRLCAGLTVLSRTAPTAFSMLSTASVVQSLMRSPPVEGLAGAYPRGLFGPVKPVGTGPGGRFQESVTTGREAAAAIVSGPRP